MYDELVKKIQHCATDPMHCLSCGEDKDGRCFKRLMTQAADAIEKLSKSRWIPVTERLPEPFENILVANKRGKHYDIDKGWWNGTFFDRCSKGGYHNVTHWMPLPEPPKEE